MGEARATTARAHALLLAGVCVLLVAAGAVTAPFLTGPPPGFTGGFGEPTCAQCHFDGKVGDPAGSLEVTGLLAALGIYGVISYAVSQRSRELGIRIAIGATGDRIVRLVLAQGLAPTLIGVVAGLMSAVWLTRVIASLLFGVSPLDLFTLAIVPAILMGVAEKGERFRALHARAGASVIPNPWDAGTARILAGLGFEALTTTSAGLAFTLGKRDGAGAVTRDETMANAKAIADATDLPVAADLENGFGDAPEDAAATIRLAGEVAGLVGGSIEDATSDPARPVYDFGHAVERVAAAAEAARALPFPFVFVARAENFLHGRPDLDDTIRRLQAFEAAGADALYAPGLTRPEDIRTVCASVGKPVNVLMGIAGATNVALSVADLEALGVRRISVGSALSRAALGAFMRAAQEIREHGTFTFARDAMPYAEANLRMGAQ